MRLMVFGAVLRQLLMAGQVARIHPEHRADGQRGAYPAVTTQAKIAPKKDRMTRGTMGKPLGTTWVSIDSRRGAVKTTLRYFRESPARAISSCAQPLTARAIARDVPAASRDRTDWPGRPDRSRKPSSIRTEGISGDFNTENAAPAPAGVHADARLTQFKDHEFGKSFRIGAEGFQPRQIHIQHIDPPDRRSAPDPAPRPDRSGRDHRQFARGAVIGI